MLHELHNTPVFIENTNFFCIKVPILSNKRLQNYAQPSPGNPPGRAWESASNFTKGSSHAFSADSWSGCVVAGAGPPKRIWILRPFHHTLLTYADRFIPIPHWPVLILALFVLLARPEELNCTTGRHASACCSLPYEETFYYSTAVCALCRSQDPRSLKHVCKQTSWQLWQFTSWICTCNWPKLSGHETTSEARDFDHVGMLSRNNPEWENPHSSNQKCHITPTNNGLLELGFFFELWFAAWWSNQPVPANQRKQRSWHCAVALPSGLQPSVKVDNVTTSRTTSYKSTGCDTACFIDIHLNHLKSVYFNTKQRHQKQIDTWRHWHCFTKQASEPALEKSSAKRAGVRCSVAQVLASTPLTRCATLPVVLPIILAKCVDP